MMLYQGTSERFINYTLVSDLVFYYHHSLTHISTNIPFILKRKQCIPCQNVYLHWRALSHPLELLPLLPPEHQAIPTSVRLDKIL